MKSMVKLAPIAACLLTALSLTACQQGGGNLSMRQDQQCQSYGAEPGTDAYINCRERLEAANQQNRAALLGALLAHQQQGFVPQQAYQVPLAHTASCVNMGPFTNCNYQ